MRRRMCRLVQQNFTPEIKVFFMLFDRSLSIFTMASLKQHILPFPVLNPVRYPCNIQVPCQGTQFSLMCHIYPSNTLRTTPPPWTGPAASPPNSPPPSTQTSRRRSASASSPTPSSTSSTSSTSPSGATPSDSSQSHSSPSSSLPSF